MYLFDIFRLGSVSNDLLIIKVGDIVIGENGITGKLKRILDILKRHSITNENHYILENQIEELESNFDKSKNEKNKLTLKAKNQLDLLTKMIYSLIVTNLRDTVIFKAYTDGDLNVKKLCDGAENFFISKVWKKMQKIEQDDLNDCVRCLLTENWTPAGVMAMRAIESIVREYYFKLTNQRMNQWWKILDKLKKHPDANQELVKELDYIREHVRNPLAHPEDRIDSHDDAEITFIHAKKVISIVHS
ncbi:MAG: hypothetical protein ACTSO7_17515 [Candidatus Heimdallarchaeota archaeon]